MDGLCNSGIFPTILATTVAFPFELTNTVETTRQPSFVKEEDIVQSFW
jgi:hypothetical protein